MFFLLIPLASAITFQQGQTIDLIDVCRDSGAPCSSGNCNKTVTYPNGTLMVDNQPMTASGSTFNYTLASSDILGEYNEVTTCCQGADCQTVESSFEITYNGGERTTKMTVVIAAGIMALLLIISAISINNPEHGLLKSVLWLFTALLVFVAIPSALLSETVAFSLFKWGLRASYVIGILILIYISYTLFQISMNYMFGMKKQ